MLQHVYLCANFSIMSHALKERIKQTADFESPMVEALLNLMTAADFVKTKINQVCARYNITQGQYNVLRILRGAHPAGYARCDIAGRMLERAPDVTRLIDRLEAQELVVRDRSAQDRRHSLARITDKGLHLLTEMSAEMSAIEKPFAERLSLAECLALIGICEKVYTAED